MRLIRSRSDEPYFENGTGCEWVTTIDLRAKPPYVRCRGMPPSTILMRQVRG